ncbi:MAG TPA: PLP-dependent aminotransferase family protein [Mycobacteriales bacterium]|nr:PLP-dependent aminotransferase family protein [Mycobacteriales bacterium]
MPELPIVLDRTGGRPLAVQVAEAVREATVVGVLRPGERLPSTRDLAGRLGVSRSVTAAAYDQLLAEGWIEGRHGSGTYVTEVPPAPRNRPARRRTAPAAPTVDLYAGSASPGTIDPAAWRRAWRAAADAPVPGRHERTGLTSMRVAVAEHLLRHRGLVVGPDAVLATAGTSAAVGEFAVAALRPGDRVGMEEPGYQRATAAFRGAGVEVVPVPVDHHGLVVSAIPAGVRAVYCTPAHQYPLGARMPADRRVALVRRARDERFWVLEDDYDGEFRFDVAPLPLLAALAPDAVVHLGTASKILTPGLGTGWLAGPPAVVAALEEHRRRTATQPSPAGQQVLTALIEHGDLARHLRRLRRVLAERRSLVVDAVRAAGFTATGDAAGAHVVVPLPSAAAERAAVTGGAAAGLALDGLARHHLGSPDRYGLVLGYAGVETDPLRRALPVLAGVLRAAVDGDRRSVRPE